MEISYDRKVIESARRIANKPDSIQKDLLKHFRDKFVSDETHEKISNIMYSLPRRR